MATIKISQVNFGGNGSQGSFIHQEADIRTVLDQTNAIGTQPVNVIVLVELSAVSKGATIQIPANTEATGLIGVNQDGQQLRDDNHKIALPCPPYCGK